MLQSFEKRPDSTGTGALDYLAVELFGSEPLAWIGARSTAGLDTAIDDAALSVEGFLDSDQPQALCELDGRTGLGPAHVGALGDACHR
jgi:hypothetical protein